MLKAAATKVDHFEPTLRWMTQQDVLWFEIAMDHSVVAHKNERTQHLDGEPSNEDSGETSELVRLDQLIQVDAQQLGRNAKVSTEVEMLCHLDNVVLLLVVLQHPSATGQNVREQNIPICADCQGS